MATTGVRDPASRTIRGAHGVVRAAPEQYASGSALRLAKRYACQLTSSPTNATTGSSNSPAESTLRMTERRCCPSITSIGGNPAGDQDPLVNPRGRRNVAAPFSCSVTSTTSWMSNRTSPPSVHRRQHIDGHGGRKPTRLPPVQHVGGQVPPLRNPAARSCWCRRAPRSSRPARTSPRCPEAGARSGAAPRRAGFAAAQRGSSNAIDSSRRRSTTRTAFGVPLADGAV